MIVIDDYNSRHFAGCSLTFIGYETIAVYRTDTDVAFGVVQQLEKLVFASDRNTLAHKKKLLTQCWDYTVVTSRFRIFRVVGKFRTANNAEKYRP